MGGGDDGGGGGDGNGEYDGLVMIGAVCRQLSRRLPVVAFMVGGWCSGGNHNACVVLV